MKLINPLACSGLFFLPLALLAGEPFRDPALPPAVRVADLLSRLTLEEKTVLCSGSFVSGGVPRLGIAPLVVSDGPVGIRLMKDDRKGKSRVGGGDGEVQLSGADRADRTTAMPGTLALAATWDRALAEQYAAAIAEEMLALHKQVLLAPAINLMRDPRGGRNYEYFGEDPYLTAEMAVAYVNGLQSHGVGSNLKHWVANECETERHFTSSQVDERTLREVYAYPFEQAIRRAQAWSIMTGNNLVNGTYVSESRPLLAGLLRDTMGFDGVILTDWRSAYQAEPSAKAGLNMTTGFCGYVYGEGRLLGLVQRGVITEAQLDELVAPVLLLYLRVGLLGDAREAGSVDTTAHAEVARRVARESIVLLKNRDHLLPLKNPRRLLLCGPAADKVVMGSGSGRVNEGKGNLSILQALRAELGAANVVYQPVAASISEADLQADLVIYCAQDAVGGEGSDLKSIQLPSGQDREIRELGARTDRLAVLLQCGTSIDTTAWDEAADAFAVVWNGGQAFGAAVADVLLGRAGFSGRLPCTFGNAIEDWPVAGSGVQWPSHYLLQGPKPKAGFTQDRPQVRAYDADYKEGVFVGYRWFDRQKLAPRYPFGFGLGTTEFQFSDLSVSAQPGGVLVRCQVANTGAQAGDEVVQLYVEDPQASVQRPAKELRGFAKVWLQPGEAKVVELPLRFNDLAFYDTGTRQWRTEAGEFVFHVGSSSRDLPLAATFRLPDTLLFDRP